MQPLPNWNCSANSVKSRLIVSDVRNTYRCYSCLLLNSSDLLPVTPVAVPGESPVWLFQRCLARLYGPLCLPCAFNARRCLSRHFHHLLQYQWNLRPAPVRGVGERTGVKGCGWGGGRECSIPALLCPRVSWKQSHEHRTAETQQEQRQDYQLGGPRVKCERLANFKQDCLR